MEMAMSWLETYLVDSSEWGDVDSLSADSSGTTDTGRVFTWSRVDNGVDQNLHWVLKEINKLQVNSAFNYTSPVSK